MGNCCSVEGQVDHWIYVKIGDRKAPGTDARLKVIVHDSKGNTSKEQTLNCVYKSQFERGGTEVFQVGKV